MTTAQITALEPILVSELPPIPVQLRRPASRLATRRAARSFELALKRAQGQERVDLLAQERAHRTVTRTVT